MDDRPIYTLAHIGLNLKTEEQAKNTAEILATLFNMDVREGGKSYWAGKTFECIRIPFRGTNGHIALRVSNLSVAIKELESKGITFDIDETTEYDEEGNVVNIYLHNEIGGFSIHLMQQ